MINVTGLTKHYGARRAVDDLSFELEAGRVTGFVGPNGAGKSTTMRMMVDLTRPDRREVRYDGFRYADLARMVAKYDPKKLKDGFNTVGGERIFYISNPALGLWSTRARFQ